MKVFIIVLFELGWNLSNDTMGDEKFASFYFYYAHTHSYENTSAFDYNASAAAAAATVMTTTAAAATTTATVTPYSHKSWWKSKVHSQTILTSQSMVVNASHGRYDRAAYFLKPENAAYIDRILKRHQMIIYSPWISFIRPVCPTS